jgi:5'-nucleotidase
VLGNVKPRLVFVGGAQILTRGDHGIDRSTEQSIVIDTEIERSGRRRILVTNDDGVESLGLIRLAAALGEMYDVVVAAPAGDFSGSGTGIGRFSPAAGVEMSPLTGFDHGAQAIHGPPGLAVLAAALGAFGEVPDLVVSGPNAGMNTGHSVIHSGTVGAVLAARNFGISGVALSLATSDPWHWDTAVHVGMQVVTWVLLQNTREIFTLNVNVPARPPGELKPAVWARLDDFGYFHIADADLDRHLLLFEVGGPDAGRDPTSDTALCNAGHVAITPLTGLETAPFPAFDASELVRV